MLRTMSGIKHYVSGSPLPQCYVCQLLLLQLSSLFQLFSHSVVSDSLRLHELQHSKLPCPSPSPRVCSNSLMSLELVMLFNRLILCHHLLLLPSIFPSIRVFSNEQALSIRWPKQCSFSLSISPSNEYSEFISFRIDWFDLLAAQGTLKSLHILSCSTTDM